MTRQDSRPARAAYDSVADASDADVLVEHVFVNEFAEARVRVVQGRTGRCVEVSAPRYGARTVLDAFALEILAQIPIEQLSGLVQQQYDEQMD